MHIVHSRPQKRQRLLLLLEILGLVKMMQRWNRATMKRTPLAKRRRKMKRDRELSLPSADDQAQPARCRS
jgi:hypothetical protein